MLELAKELKLSDELLEELEALDARTLIPSEEALLEAAKKKDGITCLALALKYASEITADEYRQRNIPHGVFLDTMQDITLWCENTGGKGLLNVAWILNHLQCRLFRIGRLQYQLYKCENETLDYNCLPFDFGDNLIYVHIPQDGRLIYSDCLFSLREAKLFFLSYFPDFHYTYFFSESWLLYRENQLFMRADSNIMQFQLLFDIVYSAPDDRQAIERIFGKRRLIKSLYPEETELQREAKAFMKKGGRLGKGIGIIHKEDIGI